MAELGPERPVPVPFDFDSCANFPTGVYYVWSETSPTWDLHYAKFCPGGCEGPWLQKAFRHFEALRVEFDLCYNVNTIHWEKDDGTITHGLAVGPLYNQGNEKGDRAMLALKEMMKRPQYRGNEFKLLPHRARASRA